MRLLLLFALSECGGRESGLTFHYDLLHGYDRNPTMPFSSPYVNPVMGVVTVTNNGSSTVQYRLPNAPGYEVVNQAGAVIRRVAAIETGIGESAEWSLLGDPAPQIITLPPGSSKSLSLLGVGSGTIAWHFDAPNDPKDIGNPSAPSSPVPPGVYRASILLLDGVRTNVATVTVCAGNGDRFPPRFGVCNDPCASAALAKELAMPVDCGATLTCP